MFSQFPINHPLMDGSNQADSLSHQMDQNAFYILFWNTPYLHLNVGTVNVKASLP